MTTGGAGYVGSACFRYLRARGHEVFAYDDLSLGNAAAVCDSRLFRGDIRDEDRLAELMARLAIDTVIHLCGLSSVAESVLAPERYRSVNLDGTQAVLRAMTRAGVRRLLFSSTGSVYGHGSGAPMAEDDPLAPNSPYASSKAAAEEMIRERARDEGIGAVIFRYFNAAGADLDGRHGEARARETRLIPMIMRSLSSPGEELTIFGGDWPTPDGTCIRDFVHVEDVAHAHLLACGSIAEGRVETYNVGSGAGTSVLEVVRECERVSGIAPRYRIADRRPGDAMENVADIARITERLGWQPKRSALRSIVETAWRWHRTHPEGYATRGPRATIAAGMKDAG
ncbi:UDP-glucose 4-epimerase GalE [Tistlia consotensis]|nr:UDP-glucose 4-epimerase GalE [Tistlia consotensis]